MNLCNSLAVLARRYRYLKGIPRGNYQESEMAALHRVIGYVVVASE